MTRKFTLALAAIIFLGAATAEAGLFKRKVRRHHAAMACAGGRCATPTTARPTAYPYAWEARVTVTVAHPPAPIIAPPATCSGGDCYAR